MHVGDDTTRFGTGVSRDDHDNVFLMIGRLSVIEDAFEALRFQDSCSWLLSCNYVKIPSSTSSKMLKKQ